MACRASIISPLTGKRVQSHVYYQLTSFYPKEEAVDIYNAMYTEGFKELLGFDWTNNTERTPDLGFSGEPSMETVDKLLNLNLTEEQLTSARQLEELAGTVDNTYEFPDYNQASAVAAEINLNPRFDAIGAKVVRTENGFMVQYKPSTVERTQVSLEDLKNLNFGDVVANLGNVEELDLLNIFNALENSENLQPFQKEIIARLKDLGKVNTSLKLAVFDSAIGEEGSQVAFYDNKTNTIYIGKSVLDDMDNSKLAVDVIHEAMHSYTIKALNEPTTPQEIVFKEKMTVAFEGYLKKFPMLSTNYGFSNVEEFASEFMSNPQFRGQLIKYQKQLKDTSFVQKIVDAIKEFFLGNFSDLPTVQEIENSVNEYLDYLLSLEDIPKTEGEYTLRFNSSAYNPNGSTDTEMFPSLANLVNFVKKNLQGRTWSELKKYLKEVDPNNRSIDLLQAEFEKIDSLEAKKILEASINYLKSATFLLKKVESQLEVYSNNEKEFTEDAIISAYNSAKNLALTIESHYKEFNEKIRNMYNFSAIEDEALREEAMQALEDTVPGILAVMSNLDTMLKETTSSISSIKDSFSNKVVRPVARKLAQAVDPRAVANAKKVYAEEITALQQQLANARAKGKKRLERAITKRITELEQFVNFQPTEENISRILSGDTVVGQETSWLGVKFNTAIHASNPTIQLVKQLIDKTTSEASISSQTFTFRASEIYNRLRELRGAVATNLDSFKNLYKGFYRIVEKTVLDEKGKKKTIKQAVLNTRFLYAEFENEFDRLEGLVQKAIEEGDVTKADQARLDLEDFLDKYAQSPYTDEYNEIQRKLIPDAKNARQALLDDIAIAQQEIPADNERIKELLRDFNRLGSIYDINGNEKPAGSTERLIADSIIEWKKERRDEDVISYDYGAKMTEWSSEKKEVENKVKKAQARLDLVENLEITDFFEPSQIENNPKAQQLLADKEKYRNEYNEAIAERNAWYEENTRSQLTPEFFEEQKKITDSIREIFVNYPNQYETDLGELYDRLFNAVLGFRDNDGVIQGSDVERTAGLRDTLKQIQTEIEEIKSKVNKDRQLSIDDKTELKRLFKELGALQSRKNTSYYTEKVKEIQGTIRSQIENDQAFMDSLEDKAKAILEIDLAMGAASVFADLEEYKQDVISDEINKRYIQTDWYTNNHITTTETKKTRSGEEVTYTSTKPLYMWTETVPNDPRFLNTELPSFKWAIPTIQDKFKNKDYRFTGKPSPKETQDGKFVNKEYTKLSAEERTILDEIVALQEDVQRSIPKGQRMGYSLVPSRKTLWEATQSALRNPFSKGSYASLYESVIAPFLPDVSDEMDALDSEEKVSIFEKRKRQLIRTRFTTPLSEAEVSFDILGNIAKYGAYSSQFDALKSIMPTVFITRDILDEKNIVDPGTLKMIDNEIAKDFYGESIGTTTNSIVDGTVRALRTAMQAGSRRVLQINTTSSIKNLMVNLMNVYLGKGIEGVSTKEFSKALTRAISKQGWIAARDISLGGANVSYYADLLMHFEANPAAIASQKSHRINQTFIRRNLSFDTLGFAVRGAFETISTLAVFEAIIEQYHVDIVENGVKRTIKLRDAYEQKEGRLVLKQGVQIEDISRLEQGIRDRIFTYYTRTQGNYYQRGRAFYHKEFLLEVLMNMKKWLAPMTINKYGDTRYQLNTGDILRGYNRTLFDRTKMLALGGGFDNISPGDKRRLKNVGLSLASAAAAKVAFKYLMLFIASKQAECDDDDCADELKTAMFSAILMSGVYDELSSFNVLGATDWSYKTFFVPPVKQPGDGRWEATFKQLAWSTVSGTFSASNQALFDPITTLYDKGLTGEFYYENSSGIKSEMTPKLLAGAPAILAAAALYTGLDVAVAPYMDTERKLYNTLKYNPRLMMSESAMLATNPIGSYEKLETETSDLKKSLSTLNKNDRVSDPEERKAVLEQMVQNEFKMDQLAKTNKFLDRVNTNKKNMNSLSQQLSRDVDKELKRYMKQNYPAEYKQMSTESKEDKRRRKEWRQQYLQDNPIEE